MGVSILAQKMAVADVAWHVFNQAIYLFLLGFMPFTHRCILRIFSLLSHAEYTLVLHNIQMQKASSIHIIVSLHPHSGPYINLF